MKCKSLPEIRIYHTGGKVENSNSYWTYGTSKTEKRVSMHRKASNRSSYNAEYRKKS